MYQPDDAMVKQLLPGTRPILQWFYERLFSDGFLRKLPYWGAVDSPPGVKTFPRMDHDGRSALVTLLFVDALQHAAQLEDAVGEKAIAANEREVARKASAAVYRRCWNAKRNLLADTPDQDSFSEHTNIFGVLTDTIPARDQAAVIQKLISVQFGHQGDARPKMAQVSYHYQFYLSRAMDKAGLGQEYLATLAPWRTMLALGLTTTPEYADPTRSDTHAWSGHPIYDLLTIVAGIHPSAPGFARVRIAPCPGSLSSFDASMPQKNGAIRVQYTRQQDGVDFVIALPANLSGDFVWNRQDHPITAGTHQFHLAATSRSDSQTR
jgi:alpha-L-rhamnosidase